MPIRLIRVILLTLALTFILVAEDTWKNVARIVAVGDIHGDFDQCTRVLRSAGVIDRDNRWSGGTHLVQTGDLLDRGPDSRKLIGLMMALEKQAHAAGGAVHCLIGNHEAMNLYGDLRYVSAADYASYKTDQSAGDSTHPLGFFERQAAFAADGPYGKWIRGHNAIIRINDMVFLHGGIGPKYARFSMRKINEEVSEELHDFSRLEGGMVMDEEGPLWYRGLAEGDETPLADHVRGVLERLGAKTLVIGHTPTKGMILPRFGGKVLLIDVGLSQVYGGHAACLVVEGGKAYAIHRGHRVPLPSMPAELAGYLSQIRAIDMRPE